MNTILLLEDEESVNRGISFTLQKEGYRVISCASIKEAEQAWKKEKSQLVICDITLPDGSGLDFVQMLRKESEVSILCLTALDQEIDQVMGYEAGADDYITKPFSLSVLLLKVGIYFKRQKREENETITSGIIRFCLKEMKVWKIEEELSLTKNEWKMLCMFLEHPKQILSKNQILETVFDVEGDFVDENTIAVNIRRLREKIEPDLSKPEYIKNIRGIGYIWDKECNRK